MTATLKFPERLDAETFATSWSRYSKTGHTLGSGTKNVEVTIFNVTKKDKIWINKYVSQFSN